MKRSLASAVLAVAAGSAHGAVHLDFDVKLDPKSRELHGRGTITGDPRASTIALGTRFEFVQLRVNGASLTSPPVVKGDQRIWRLPPARDERRIEVEWRGMLAPLDAGLSHRDTLTRAAPVADERGSFLPAEGGWHPTIDRAAVTYSVAIELPAGQKGLAPGRLADESETGGTYRARFEFPHPVYGIDLMVGPYQVETADVRSATGKSLRLRTYFHTDLAGLAAGYLDAAKRYLDLYEHWIGEYPYTEFSIVSSPTPTGLGMPTLTYLGIDVLRLPFIRATSLGHEVLHNWWGNGVFPDYTRGNWAEGLTTLMADYANREREGVEAARAMRLDWLGDAAAVPAGTDRPLQEFRSRTHGASQIVGYHKAAMVLLMLRDQMGRAVFDDGLRQFWREHRFRTASWDDLRRAFERTAGGSLAPYFAQWLSRSGAPSIRLAGAEAERERVRVVLEQSAPPWRVRVPVVVRTERGEVAQTLELGAERASFTINVDAPATAVVLDPDFRVYRRLGVDEAPPILRRIMIDPATALVVASPGTMFAERAVALAEKLVEQRPNMHAREVPPPAAPVLAIGLHDDVDAWLARYNLPPRPEAVGRRGSVQVWVSLRDTGKAVATISVKSEDALAHLARPLPHYGRQSWLILDGSQVLDRGIWPARPQERRLH